MMYALTAIISIALSAIITTMILGARLEKFKNEYDKYLLNHDNRLERIEPTPPADSMSEAFKRMDNDIGKVLGGK